MTDCIIDDIFKVFDKSKENIEIKMDEVKNNLGNLKDKIVLYGAGSAGIAFLHYLRDVEIFPLYFSDGNPKKWGQECEGLKIISPNEIIEYVGEEALVIVTINTDGKIYCKSFDKALRQGGHNGVHLMLKEYGCKNTIDYTNFRKCFSLFCDDIYNLPSCSDVNWMEKNRKQITEVYSMLADTMSKRIYHDIVKFRMLDDTIQIPTIKQDNQYFEYDLYKKIKNEVFVDCGAYNGITLMKFIEYNRDFLKYYAFEPDEHNILNLKKCIMNLDPYIQEKIHVEQSAVMDRYGDTSLYSLGGPGSFLSSLGSKKVDTTTIDGIVRETPVSFIKMNIEGAEIKALLGAEKTIRECKPTLAIAGYHKTWDLWEIPLLIKKYNPEYKIYLRSYMNHISFVYYAIPITRCMY